MRCATNCAVTACLQSSDICDCPDCKAMINLFYTGDAETSPKTKREGLPKPEVSSPGPLAFGEWSAKPPAKAAAAETPPAPQQDLRDLYGITADDLCPGFCWFHVCCKKCIARHRCNCCCKVGEYCGVYVVVERSWDRKC